MTEQEIFLDHLGQIYNHDCQGVPCIIFYKKAKTYHPVDETGGAIGDTSYSDFMQASIALQLYIRTHY